jgi:hypothetical protein
LPLWLERRIDARAGPLAAPARITRCINARGACDHAAAAGLFQKWDSAVTCACARERCSAKDARSERQRADARAGDALP